MKPVHQVVLIALIGIISSRSYSQEKVLYKKIGTVQLYLEVHTPANSIPNAKSTAIVFFFGGGWINGDRSQFLHQAEYFSRRGAVCFLADYRTQMNHTTPFESLKDAKSAIRFIRKHAADFGIDTARIVACGGSAGGHLAAATALIDSFNEVTDNRLVNCRPNALVLFNPVIDNGPGGYGYDRIGEQYKNFSPLHNIRKGAPPTVIFLGTNDKLVPVATAEYYKTVMDQIGSRCDLKLYEGQSHGFFNYSNFNYYKSTLTEADTFLQSLGFLNAEPEVEIN
jgi:acetyl esterase